MLYFDFRSKEFELYPKKGYIKSFSLFVIHLLIFTIALNMKLKSIVKSIQFLPEEGRPLTHIYQRSFHILHISFHMA